MERFYREYKEMRKNGMSVDAAFRWAKAMRACNYNPFID